MRKVIAAWGLTNTSSLNVYEIKHDTEDWLLVGVNNNRPYWYKVRYDDRDYILFGKEKYYLDECERVGGGE